jgi:hypothetical protein
MRNRGQLLAALLVLAGVIVSAVYLDREVGARPLENAGVTGAPSGVWLCPHGGGSKDWDVRIQLANPGSEPVPVRVRTMTLAKPAPPEDHVVEPGSTLVIPVSSEGRESSTSVEYFGGFVAAGWIAHAGDDASGVAAEPCLPDSSPRWLLPDGTTADKSADDYVVVMNPFATDAVISFTLLSDRRDPVRTEEWTNVTLKPYHSRAFRLNDKEVGETTVSTVVDVSVGRVAAATLGISTLGGIRSAVGLPAGATTQILPGAADAGRTDLAVMSAGLERVSLSGTSLGAAETAQPLAALADAAPGGESARTIPLTTGSPTTLVVQAAEPDVAFARRTFGVASDQASTTGAIGPADAWIVLPSVIGQPSHPAIVLANPGQEPATLTLSALPGEGQSVPEPITVELPPMSTTLAPKAFVAGSSTSSVMIVASSGTFVASSASYALGREGYATFAVAMGVPIPAAWVPSP